MNEETTEKDKEIISLVKNKCYVTDASDLTNNRINAIIQDAIIKVSEMIGIKSYDFSKPGKERELFLNYCFYMWNDKSIAEFENNYLSDIYKLRSFYEVNEEMELKDSEELQ